MKLRKLAIKTVIAAFIVIIIAMALSAMAWVYFTESVPVALAAIILVHLVGLTMAIVAYRLVATLVLAIENFAGRVEHGDFGARFVTDAGSEATELTTALNSVLDRLRASIESETATRQRLAFLVSASTAVIYAARADGDYGATWISPSISRQLGYAPEDFINDPGFWVGHIHPEDRDRVLEHQAGLFTAGRIESEYRFRHQDGSWRWMHDQTMLVRDEAGEPLELVGSWIDITARKALEASLVRRDAILEAIAYGSARFLHGGEDDSIAQWNLGVGAVLAHLGEAADVSRVWVFENAHVQESAASARPIHHWTRPQYAVAAPDPLFAQEVSYERDGLGVEALRLRRGEVLQLRISQQPEPWRSVMERLGVRSAALAPITINGEWWGLMSFDDCAEERQWTEPELEGLRAAANLFGAAIAGRAGREKLRASLETLGSVLEKLKRQSADIMRQNATLQESEDALQRSTQLLTSVVENMPAMLFIKRASDLRFEMFNRAGEQILGYSRSDMIGKNVHDLLPAAEADAFAAQDRKVLASKDAIEYPQEEITTASGETRTLWTRKVALRNAAGEPTHLLGMSLDITESLRAQTLLEQANRSRTEFLNNVTHELRTPLHGVIGFAELLKDEVPGPLNAEQAEFAADILASGLRLQALVDGILTMSQIDAMDVHIVREPVAIGATLEALTAARHKAAQAQGVTLRVSVTPDTGTLILDPQALRRVVDALLDNAIKFNREGGTVTLSARRDDGWLEIAVADTGIGIAAADLPKLFQPLVQLDAGLARRHGGVGMGLALARRLAELHGGHIAVASEPGKCSTFTLRLPAGDKPS
jgi:PAS domain S-box-containing protein